MEKLVIAGGVPLRGEVNISGSKNATLPLMAASILAAGKSVLRSVPELRDVLTMGSLLKKMGAGFSLRDSVCDMDTSGLNEFTAPYELVKTMRASVLVLGPLVARYGQARVSLPGGCAIGARPINLHLMGLERMGAEIELAEGYVKARARSLNGASIYFDVPTVTGTENLMMAAALAKGTTVLENCAREPEVVDLAEALIRMGARIEGAGGSLIEIEGVDELRPYDYDVIPDRIEAATFAIASAITGGDVSIKTSRPDFMDAIMIKLRETRVDAVKTPDGLRVKANGNSGRPASVNITTMPYPGFPTDVQAQFMALMCVANGTSIINETVFENRFMHVPELQRMGAQIVLQGGMASVTGVEKLKGAQVMATDLRASASLVLAALAAEGESEIHRLYHLDRGYEKMEKKLRHLGAQIMRVPEQKG
ncbi:MAG: UDP-N-acetylglucosamine 1-carboxyvinyltransferase [Actinomycetota bacterium]|nr:UDP-N-acetylglucosamine 1-carboxyvinyltransferase [Actinomycetota bacterium]